MNAISGRILKLTNALVLGNYLLGSVVLYHLSFTTWTPADPRQAAFLICGVLGMGALFRRPPSPSLEVRKRALPFLLLHFFLWSVLLGVWHQRRGGYCPGAVETPQIAVFLIETLGLFVPLLVMARFLGQDPTPAESRWARFSAEHPWCRHLTTYGGLLAIVGLGWVELALLVVLYGASEKLWIS